VSNFFFPGVTETKHLNACSFLREIKGDFKQEDHRFQKRGWEKEGRGVHFEPEQSAGGAQ
jgi:hypothetical protein